MKKKSIILACFLMLSLLFCLPASAEGINYFVLDEAGILSDSETEDLTNKARTISNAYDFGVYILTVDDYERYTHAHDRESAAEEIYLSYDLGVGSSQDGMILLISVDTRDWAMFAFGYGNTAFTDYGKEHLADAFLGDLGNDDWYSGFNHYLIRFNEMMEEAANGTPVDVTNWMPPAGIIGSGIVVCVLLGLLIALIVAGVLTSQMKSVYVGDEAFEFIDKQGLRLSHRSDVYTHTTRSRVYDPPQSSSSGGGGTSIRSSGGSSAGGKF